MTRFFLRLLLLTVITSFAIGAWNKYAPVQKQLNDLWWILLFFVILSGSVHYILVKAGDKKPTQFIRNFMGITALKLFLYLLIMVAYRFINPGGAAVFLVGFLMHYLIFTVFEVVSILSYFKK